MLIVELVQFERQKVKDACRDAENVKAKEVGFTLAPKLQPSNSIWPYLSSDLVKSEREYC